MQISKMQLCALLLAASFAGGAFATVLQAFADGDPSTDAVPRIVPYQGVLELNGQPVNAVGEQAVSIRFELFDGAEAEAPVYSQSLAVEVYGGRFTAGIGPTDDSGIAIADVIAGADDLHLGMTLLNQLDNPEDDVTMANRQRILASPYAMWSTTATHFVVGNSLTVAGPTDLNGGVAVTGDASVSGDSTLNNVTVNGLATLNGVNLAYEPWGSGGDGDGGAAIKNDNGEYQRLMIVGNNSAGGRRQVGLWDDVTINNDLDVGGTLRAGSFRHRNCTWRGNGLGWNDNTYHQVFCAAGEFMTGWRCYATDRLDGECAAYCCSP